MEDKYIPVNSFFYDELEALLTRGRPVKVVFWNDGGKAVIQGKIEDIGSNEGVSFLKMASGLRIRLDKLIEVDGKLAAGFG